jgi:hypothetical protein
LVFKYSEEGVASELPVEDIVFSAGGGFLFGAVAGYAIIMLPPVFSCYHLLP